MKNQFKKVVKKTNYALLVLAISTTSAFASSAGGSDNPIITGLQKWSDLATGTMPRIVGMLALAFVIFQAIFSDKMGSATKKVVGICIGILVLVGAGQLLSWMGVSGALI